MEQNDLLLMKGILEALDTPQNYEPGKFKIYDKDGNVIDEFTDENPEKFDDDKQILEFIQEVRNTFKLSTNESNRLTSCENLINGIAEDISFSDLDVLIKLSGRKNLSQEVIFKCIAAYEFLTQNLDVLDTNIHYPEITKLASDQAELIQSIFTPVTEDTEGTEGKYDVACDSN